MHFLIVDLFRSCSKAGKVIAGRGIASSQNLKGERVGNRREIEVESRSHSRCPVVAVVLTASLVETTFTIINFCSQALKESNIHGESQIYRVCFLIML